VGRGSSTSSLQPFISWFGVHFTDSWSPSWCRER